MADYVVVMDSPRSLKVKRVLVYLENDNGVHRQIQRDVPITVDVDAYVTNNFSELFAMGDPLADAVWDQHFERQFNTLYRAVVLAGVGAAKGQSATLVDVTSAMEAELLASDKAGAYSKLLSLASGASRYSVIISSSLFHSWF